MHPAEVVVHVVEGHGMNVVLPLLTESIGQPGKPAHRHAHGEVLPLNVGSRDVIRIGPSDNGFHV